MGVVVGDGRSAPGGSGSGLAPGRLVRLDLFVARALAWVGEESEGASAARFAALRRFLVLAVAVESWNALRYQAYQEAPVLHTGLAALQLVCLGAAWSGPLTRLATLASATALAIGVAIAFPFNANHQAVEILCLALVGLARPDVSGERCDSLRGVRWVAVAVMFWAGAQKLLFGLYFGGEFLAHRVAVDSGFAEIFRLVMPESEWQRLLALEAVEGSGPYRVDSWLFVAISNLSWMTELALAGALLHPRMRRLAWPAGIAFLLVVELAAREVFFGALLCFLLLLFEERRLAARALPAFGLGYAYLFAMAVGWLPHWSFG